MSPSISSGGSCRQVKTARAVSASDSAPYERVGVIAAAGGAVVGVDVLCGAVPPALLREAVAAAPALAAPLLGASPWGLAPR